MNALCKTKRRRDQLPFDMSAHREPVHQITPPIELVDKVLIERELCHRSLYEFSKCAWGVIDPAEYLDNWHIQCICEHLEAVYFGEIINLCINVPPRFMKSLLCSVNFPAWVWVRDNTKKFFLFSYAFGLAIGDAVKCRRLIESDWYQLRWGSLSGEYGNYPVDKRVILTDDQNEKKKYETTKMGCRQCSSVGGTVTGIGGEYKICDDPHNVIDVESSIIREGTVQWWRESVTSRSNTKDSASIIIAQRTHEMDLPGVAIEELGYYPLVLPMEYESNHKYVFLNDPRKEEGQLLWNSRFDEPSIKNIQMTMGDYAYAGQYQQRPTSRKGGLFDVSKILYITRPLIPKGGIITCGWDLAASDKENPRDRAYTVRVKLKYVDNCYIVLDVKRYRARPGETKGRIVQIVQHDFDDEEIPDSISFPEDPGAAGKVVVADWKDVLDGYPIHSSPESGSKTARAEAIAAQVDIGKFYLLYGKWNKEFIDELKSFPKGAFLDQVDALSRAYWRIQTIKKMREGTAAVAYGNVIEGKMLSPDQLERQLRDHPFRIHQIQQEEKSNILKQNLKVKKRMNVPKPILMEC